MGISPVVLFGLLVPVLPSEKATSSEAHNGITINITGYQWWWRVEYLHPDPQPGASLPPMSSTSRSAVPLLSC